MMIMAIYIVYKVNYLLVWLTSNKNSGVYFIAQFDFKYADDTKLTDVPRVDSNGNILYDANSHVIYSN